MVAKLDQVDGPDKVHNGICPEYGGRRQRRLHLLLPSPFCAHHFMRHFAAGDRLAQAHVWNRSYKWLHAASQFSRPDHHLIIAEKDAFIASIFCYFYGLPIVRLQCRSLNVTPAVANTW